MLLIGEMMILMIVARYFYRRDVKAEEDTEPRKLIDNEAPMAISTPGLSCDVKDEKVVSLIIGSVIFTTQFALK